MGNAASSFDNPAPEKVLMLFIRLFSPVFGALSVNITREIAAYFGFQPHILPAICGNTCVLYDLHSNRLQEWHFPHKVTTGAVYSFLTSVDILVVGGHPECRCVLLLNTTRKEGQLLKEMKAARAWPGIIAIGRDAYIFGGNFPSVRTAEKWEWGTGRCRELEDMQFPRFAFTPCRYREMIYLLDFPQTHKRGEVFNTRTEAYAVLPVHLPAFSCLNSMCFIVREELVVLCEGNPGECIQWKLTKTGETSLRKLPNSGIRPYSPTPPLLHSNLVYYTNIDDRQLIRFDPASSTFSKVTFPSI